MGGGDPYLGNSTLLFSAEKPEVQLFVILIKHEITVFKLFYISFQYILNDNPILGPVTKLISNKYNLKIFGLKLIN